MTGVVARLRRARAMRYRMTKATTAIGRIRNGSPSSSVEVDGRVSKIVAATGVIVAAAAVGAALGTTVAAAGVAVGTGDVVAAGVAVAGVAVAGVAVAGVAVAGVAVAGAAVAAAAQV